MLALFTRPEALGQRGWRRVGLVHWDTLRKLIMPRLDVAAPANPVPSLLPCPTGRSCAVPGPQEPRRRALLAVCAAQPDGLP